MQYLLTLPHSLTPLFHSLEEKSSSQWFVTSDPEGNALGSGGGTAYLLSQCWRNQGSGDNFESWLEKDKRILIHAGGKSRRLPAYASTGKILTPIPVFRWKKGQQIDQKLLDIQVPIYEKILKQAPSGLNTLIASGDILIVEKDDFGTLPEADILVFGTWTEAIQASKHGVFFCDRDNPEELAFILQKPSLEKIRELNTTHYFLMDVGIWLLSSRAVNLLMKACGWDERHQKFNNSGNMPEWYDLYGEFSRFLGSNPQENDPGLNSLSTVVIPVKSGSFYHYGTSRELIESTFRIQNMVTDQREIWHKRVKPHPDIFIMNSVHDGILDDHHRNLWIENAYIPAGWNFSGSNIFTGIPQNNWHLNIPSGICIDMVPVGEEQWCVRPYGLDDTFRGMAGDPATSWMNGSLSQWFEERQIKFEEAGVEGNADIHDLPLFPVVNCDFDTGDLIRWMISNQGESALLKEKWVSSERLSASQILKEVNLERLYRQREKLLARVLPAIEKNHRQSIFYQLDLDRLSSIYHDSNITVPDKIENDTTLINKIHNRMFLARVSRKMNKKWKHAEEEAFELLREGMIKYSELPDEKPIRSVFHDQIVWARCPVRIDLAGGWSDTPPYCIINGGRVMNLAVELNGQPPVQVYITPSETLQIRIKSIDLGQEYLIREYNDIENYLNVGSGFAIANVALMLSGFHPVFGAPYISLNEQLKHFGGGFDISLLAAVPKGSGLGTSSILAAALLGALSEYCGLKNDHATLGTKTLVLEQMLTTGGGWQDQYGGILPGVKVIETVPGFEQVPEIRWLPENLFRKDENRSCMLLYYTGVTRVAKNILSEIVRGMFLNRQETLNCVDEIKSNAIRISEAVRKDSWKEFNRCVELSWELNQQLDEGTNPPEIQNFLKPVESLLLSKKLLGAGGGGYLLMIARDPEAAVRIKAILSAGPPNEKARFVNFKVSEEGLTITKS